MNGEDQIERRAVVTAGASGIGRVVAETLLGAGWRVSICDLDKDALERFANLHPRAFAHHCDVADAEAVANTATAILGQLGGVDLLVNNAGTPGPTAEIEAIEPADWARCIEVNLGSQYLFIRAVVPSMKAQGSGLIVNMSSAAGRLGMPLRTPYVAAKWGVIGLTQSLAMELGPHGIRVNAILPGSVRGDRMDRVMRARAEKTGRPLAEIEAEEVSAISLGRMIDPDEIADLVLYLGSPSGRSISGQSLGLCGNTEVLR